MIPKKDFIDVLSKIKAEQEHSQELHKTLHDAGVTIDYENPYIRLLLDVLKAGVPDPYEYIDWWLFEDVDHIIYKEDGHEVEADVTEPGALYDYLTSPKGMPAFENIPQKELPEWTERSGIPTIGMELSDFVNYMEVVLDYLETHEAMIHIMRDGESKYVLMPVKQYEQRYGELRPAFRCDPSKYDILELQIEPELERQAREALKYTGFSLEQISEMFLSWCALYPEDAKAWYERAMNAERREGIVEPGV